MNYKDLMLIQIGKEWLTRDKGGCFSATHLSPSQLNKIPDQWFYDYCVLTAEQRKQLPANSRMIFGGIVGQALQDIIVHKLTIQEVMRGKK